MKETNQELKYKSLGMNYIIIAIVNAVKHIIFEVK